MRTKIPLTLYCVCVCVTNAAMTNISASSYIVHSILLAL